MEKNNNLIEIKNLTKFFAINKGILKNINTKEDFIDGKYL